MEPASSKESNIKQRVYQYKGFSLRSCQLCRSSALDVCRSFRLRQSCLIMPSELCVYGNRSRSSDNKNGIRLFHPIARWLQSSILVRPVRGVNERETVNRLLSLLFAFCFTGQGEMTLKRKIGEIVHLSSLGLYHLHPLCTRAEARVSSLLYVLSRRLRRHACLYDRMSPETCNLLLDTIVVMPSMTLARVDLQKGQPQQYCRRRLLPLGILRSLAQDLHGIVNTILISEAVENDANGVLLQTCLTQARVADEKFQSL